MEELETNEVDSGNPKTNQAEDDEISNKEDDKIEADDINLYEEDENREKEADYLKQNEEDENKENEDGEDEKEREEEENKETEMEENRSLRKEGKKKKKQNLDSDYKMVGFEADDRIPKSTEDYGANMEKWIGEEMNTRKQHLRNMQEAMEPINSRMAEMENEVKIKVNNKNKDDDLTVRVNEIMEDKFNEMKAQISHNGHMINIILKHSNEGLKVSVQNLKALYAYLEMSPLERTSFTVEGDIESGGPSSRTRRGVKRKVPEIPNEMLKLKESIDLMENMQKEAEEAYEKMH